MCKTDLVSNGKNIKTIRKLIHDFKTLELLYSWRDQLNKSDKLIIFDKIYNT